MIGANAVRMQQLVEGYLARRLDGAGLRALQEMAGVDESVWNDTYSKTTSRDRTLTSEEALDSEALESLGLSERYQALNDDTVWSAEDRALYRRLTHPTLIAAEAEVAVEPPKYDFLEAALARFEKGDKNHDLVLDDAELDHLMAGGHFGELADEANDAISASTIVVMRRYSTMLQSVVPMDGEGISRADLSQLRKPKSENVQKIANLVNEEFSRYLDDSAQVDLQKPLSQEDVSPFSIHQGSAGSCVFLSSLAGSTPKSLNVMLTPLEDRKYSVRFYDGAKETVEEPTLSERLFHSRGTNMDRWPAILEKAMVQRLYSDRRSEVGGAVKDIIDGISPQDAILATTGLETDQRNLDEMTVNETRSALRDLTQQEGPVICATRPRAIGDFISIEELHNGLPNGHAFTVLGYDAKTDQVKLRNPYGHGEWDYQQGPDEGIFEMPVRDFYTSFRWVAGAKLAPFSNE